MIHQLAPTRRRTGLWIAAAVALATCPTGSPAEPTQPGRPCGDPDDPGTGLLFTEIDGRTVEFPLKHTFVHADVAGAVARVRVTQTFGNPYEDTIEAVYVFPLPHEAAVSDYVMTLGDREIQGVIQRREIARQMYENARRSGHVAALLEQERPNIFTQSVANILPGNEIEVTLTYVETLDYEAGTWELVFPTVVGPRFNPPTPRPDVITAGFDERLLPFFGGGEKRSSRDAVENPPYLAPGVRSGHDLEIEVDWDAGIPIEELTSPTHRIDRLADGDTHRRIKLHRFDSIPNKDFVLRARARGEGPDTGVLAYGDGEDGYVSVLLHPKLDLTRRDLTPKEMIFVLDCSGSMSGEPIAAAKALVRRALTNVNEGDTFQIIRFSSGASGFAPRPVAATPRNVKRGLSYLDSLNGTGGTMMIEGIKAALDFPRDDTRLRIVMFLTDGYIGNEDQIFAAVRDRIGDARLFSFGVGSSVNRFLLDGLAEEGRGEVAYFLPGSSVEESVTKFYDRFRNPYLTDLQLTWDGVDVDEVYPTRIPDLFGGKPLAVYARADQGGRGTLVVTGKLAGRPWSQKVRFDVPRHEGGNPAVATLWARAKIGDLERRQRGAADASTVEEITRVALKHRLVTSYTSFVAVEDRLVVSNGQTERVQVPVEMPEGVSHEGVFGTGARQEMYAGKSLAASPVPGAIQERLRGLGYIGGGSAAAPQSKTAPSTNESDVAGRDREIRADLPVADEAKRRAPESSSLLATLELVRSEIGVGDRLEITITLENVSSVPMTAPDPTCFAWDDGSMFLKIVDSAWNETVIGTAPTPGNRCQYVAKVLAPGEKVVLKLVLGPDRVPALSRAGTLHLRLEGPRIRGAADRWTVRVR